MIIFIKYIIKNLFTLTKKNEKKSWDKKIAFSKQMIQNLEIFEIFFLFFKILFGMSRNEEKNGEF